MLIEVPSAVLNEARTRDEAKLLAGWMSKQATGGTPGFDELATNPRDVLTEWQRTPSRRSWLIRTTQDSDWCGFASLAVDDANSPAMFNFHLAPDAISSEAALNGLVDEVRSTVYQYQSTTTVLAWTSKLNDPDRMGSDRASTEEVVSINERAHRALGFEVVDEAFVWRRRAGPVAASCTSLRPLEIEVHHGPLGDQLSSSLERMIEQCEDSHAVNSAALTAAYTAMRESRDCGRVTVIGRSVKPGSSDGPGSSLGIVGIAVLLPTSPEALAFYNAFTFVATDYRGQALAARMKNAALASVSTRSKLTPWVYSWTDIDNGRINAVNERLGYVAIGRQRVWRRRSTNQHGCSKQTPPTPRRG